MTHKHKLCNLLSTTKMQRTTRPIDFKQKTVTSTQRHRGFTIVKPPKLGLRSAL